MGTDHFGNQYFEIKAQPELGKRKPSRWYSIASQHHKGSLWETGRPTKTHEEAEGWDQEVPSEWDSRLRFRRDNPPSEEEVLQNVRMAQMKKINAARLEEERVIELRAAGVDPGPPKLQEHEKPTFPKYDDMESIPGELGDKKQHTKWDTHKNPYAKK